MNYTTVKKLHGIALLLKAVSVLLIILMTICQKAVRPMVLDQSNLNDIFTIPVELLVSVIPTLILFGLSYLLMKKNSGTNSTTHVIIFLTVMLAFQVLMPYINTLIVRGYAALHSVNQFAAYTALETAISYVISPIQGVAFALFCLSLGGYYGMESKME